MSAAPKAHFIQPNPVEIKNILLTTDFGPASEVALLYVRAIAMRHGSKVYVLHVMPPEPRLEVPLDKFPNALDSARQVATEQMVKLLKRDPLNGVAHDALLERGCMTEVVSNTIEQNNIDMVVVGTHGHRGLKKMVLGSTAEEIFRLAKCPVMTLGSEVVKHEDRGGDFSRILFATDFSPGSIRALPWALSFAREEHANLVMLHVVDEISEAGVEYLDEVTAACKQRMTELLPPGAGNWCQPSFFVEFGAAADTILKIAEEHQSDLIVMGARAASLPAAVAHLPWATAYSVVCHARCPVLTVKS